MKKISSSAWDMILKALDSVCSIAVLPFGLFMVSDSVDPGSPMKNRLFMMATFLSLCLSMVWQALRRKNRSEPFGWQLVQAGVYLISAILTLALPHADVSQPIITWLVAAMLILNRVRSIVRKHTYRSVLFNAACILLIAAAAVLGSFSAVFVYMMVLNLGHIVSLSFSGMDMKILSRIIRKTYAADILSGLLLLMTAFSFMFPVLEENISTFQDALWYCFALVTTIGFGDYAAVSTLGRVMSALLGAYGIVVVALITSVVVNFYSEVKSQPDQNDDKEAP